MSLSNGLAQAIQVLEEAVQSVPLTELPALLGKLEKAKALGWGRMLTGPGSQHGQGEDELLTVPEVAKRLKLSTYRIYDLCRQGVLKSVRLGKSVRVKSAAMTEYLTKQGA
jgi:excisionase family DNA binding protein